MVLKDFFAYLCYNFIPQHRVTNDDHSCTVQFYLLESTCHSALTSLQWLQKKITLALLSIMRGRWFRRCGVLMSGGIDTDSHSRHTLCQTALTVRYFFQTSVSKPGPIYYPFAVRCYLFCHTDKKAFIFLCLCLCSPHTALCSYTAESDLVMSGNAFTVHFD